MKEPKAGHRYASALIQIAEELNKLDVIANDLRNIQVAIEKSRDFSLFLKSPIINTEKKKKAIAAIFQNKVDDLTFKFLLLLVTKNRESLIPSIIESFWKLLDEKNGIVNAELTTVIPPTEEQIERIKKQLEAITKRKIRLLNHMDSSLIGGFVIKIEDTIFDASVLNQFNILKKKFLAASASTKSKI